MCVEFFKKFVKKKSAKDVLVESILESTSTFQTLNPAVDNHEGVQQEEPQQSFYP